MLKIGNYVDWCEDYADGIAGRDWGSGVIIDTQILQSSDYDDCLMYKVYRNKHKDLYWFEERQLKQKEIK